MSPPVKQSTFSGGEISPALYARTDHALYEKSLRTLRNMIAMRHGGVTGRPGTQYVATTLNSGSAVRLIPFIFNETGNGQSYVLEFGNLYIAFYQNGGVVTSGGSPYTIVSPYAQADLATLQFAQTNDVITITHPTYAPRELARVTSTSWTLTSITFGPSISSPTFPALAGTAGTANMSYWITSVNSSGEESDSVTPITSSVLTKAAPTTPVTVTWTAASGAVSYRIYNSPGLSGSPPGFIGISTTTSFIDTGITPDYANVFPNRPTLFSSTGNYPTTVGFVQQRRGFANTVNNPIGFWLSRPGAFANFDTHVTIQDSDAVIGTIAGDEVNGIEHLAELKFMLMLTAGAEIYVQGNGSGVVTPSAINASTQSQYGCAPLRPLKVGDTLVFNQALGSFIRDFTFDFAIDGYRGNDITVFASHLFEGYSIADWAYQKTPDSIIWAARSDGVLLSCTYVREQQVLAWAHHDFTNGSVQNVCSIPENGSYAVYLTIQRVINGSTVLYLERLSSRIWTDDINATYLDCFSTYNGINAATTTMTLTASGAFQTDGTAYQQSLTLTASAGFFTSSMVGDQIFIYDSAFNTAQGNEVDPENPGSGNVPPATGNMIQCTIQAYTSTTVVTVTPSGAVPSDLQNTAVTTWSHAVKSVSGLTYLAGQQVSVWADRYVVGSPLNYHVSTVYTVPASGILTLDKCYAVIYVGLPMVQDFQTLDIETSVGESILAKRKRAAKLALYLYKTRTLFGGSEDPAANTNNSSSQALFQLNELKTGTYQLTYDQAPDLVTDQEYIVLESRFNKNGRLFIRNVDPTPLTILAVSPDSADKAPSPFYKKV